MPTDSVLPGSTDGIIDNAVAAAMPEYALFATSLIWPCRPPIAWFNWLTLTASVPLTPGATLLIVRSLPGEPTDTVFGALATEPAPSATEFTPDAVAF